MLDSSFKEKCYLVFTRSGVVGTFDTRVNSESDYERQEDFRGP
jgi:hypothetical protein